jgi:glutamate-1-semialdehyde aminotransferase
VLDDHRTADLIARSRLRLGWGEVSTRLRPLHYDALTPLPHFTSSVSGCEVTDSSGRTFIDWNLGGGCMILGYRRREIEEAITAQLAAGPLSPFTHAIEIEVAERIAAAIPSGETVAFGKNGSDGLTAAVRLARAFTGREVILCCGYHGFHDWFAALDARIRGVPASLGAIVDTFVYNDLPSLEALFERHRDRVAAVVMEPTKAAEPLPGFLAGVRERCDREGALLVFDEVVTAFRVDRSGAQALYGVLPDLTCLGKAMGNGMPLSAVTGPHRIMRHFSSVGVGMTYEGETLSLAAARACLSILHDEPVVQHLHRAGEAVRGAFQEEAASLGVDAFLTGHPARQQILFRDQQGMPSDYLLGLFLTECLHFGLITNGTLLPSYAHDGATIERSSDALRRALRAVAAQMSHPERVWRLPPEPAIQGYVESVAWDGNRVAASGWLLVDGKSPLELMCSGQVVVLERPDVGAALETDQVRCGWSIESVADDERDAIVTVVARGKNSEVPFTIAVRREPLRELPLKIEYGAVIDV